MTDRDGSERVPARPAAGVDPDALLAAVRDGGLLTPGRPVVVLLSGGRDSVALCDVTVRICGPSAVSAVHVNYGLRPSSGRDERVATALCARLGIPLHAVAAGARGPGNLQAWAREVRYREAASVAALRGGADLASGHTADDQLETMLYRLASSPSRRALLGMRARDGGLIRPLLNVSRQQTTAYCAARGLEYVNDPSNDTDAFARGRVRHALVPALERIHPAARENALALLEILRDESDVLDAATADVLGASQEIPLSRLRELPPALARLVVQRLADAAVGRLAPGTARRAAELAAMGDDAHIDLPHGLRASTRNGVLRFAATPPH